MKDERSTGTKIFKRKLKCRKEKRNELRLRAISSERLCVGGDIRRRERKPSSYCPHLPHVGAKVRGLRPRRPRKGKSLKILAGQRAKERQVSVVNPMRVDRSARFNEHC